MADDFHDKVHEDISAQLATLNALLLGLAERLARIEARVAFFSGLTGLATGAASSFIVTLLQRH